MKLKLILTTVIFSINFINDKKWSAECINLVSDPLPNCPKFLVVEMKEDALKLLPQFVGEYELEIRKIRNYTVPPAVKWKWDSQFKNVHYFWQYKVSR